MPVANVHVIFWFFFSVRSLYYRNKICWWKKKKKLNLECTIGHCLEFIWQIKYIVSFCIKYVHRKDFSKNPLISDVDFYCFVLFGRTFYGCLLWQTCLTLNRQMIQNKIYGRAFYVMFIVYVNVNSIPHITKETQEFSLFFGRKF